MSTYQKEIASNPVTVVTTPTDPVYVQPTVYATTPDADVGYFVELLEDPGNSPDQNVDGSVTPVVFEWSPDPGLGEILVRGFRIILIANNISSFFDYGNRAALPNGVLFQSEITGVGVFDYANIQSNSDFIQLSSDAAGASFEQQGNNTQDGQALNLAFPDPIKADSNFTFRITIRDDLRALSYQRASVFYSTS